MTRDNKLSVPGLIADMGLYTGPWPLLPPGEQLDTGYVFFILALPNPAAPRDTTRLLDYTYDTPFWASYRFGVSPSQFGYGGDPRTNTDHAYIPLPSTPPPGIHLYVYILVEEPPQPPSFYVPASYAATGTAAHETSMGHWSDWQPAYGEEVDGPDAKASIQYDASQSFSLSRTRVEDDPAWDPFSVDVDVADKVDELLGGLLAGPPVEASLVPAAGVIVEASKHNDIDLPAEGYASTQVAVTISTKISCWDLTSFIDHPVGAPAGYDALSQFEQVALPPYVDQDGLICGVGYEWASSRVGYSLVDHQGFCAVGNEWVPGDGSGLLPRDEGAFNPTIRVAWRPGDATAEESWAPDGAPALDVTLTTFDPSDAHWGTIDLSQITDEIGPIFSLILYPVANTTGRLGAVDFPQPDPTMGDPVEWSYRRGSALELETPLRVIKRLPEWRYWIPGPVVDT